METFEEWEKVTHLDHLPPELAAELAWEAATLAERERCAKVCSSLWDLRHDSRARMYAAKCADAIRGES